MKILVINAGSSSLKYQVFRESVIENGAIKIIAEKALQLQAELNEFCKTNIQVPEYYFTLDELDTLSLDWNEIEAFMPFIK